MESGRCISRDIAKSEAVEHELAAFVSKRHDRRVADEGEGPARSRVGSERAYFARLEAERRAAWVEYHRSQAEHPRRTMENLIAHHEAQAEKHTDPKGCAA